MTVEGASGTTGWAGQTGHIDARIEREVAVITMDRPDKLNALTADMRRELAAAIRFFGDGTRARGVVVTGAGRAFSAGEDLAEAVAEAADGVESAIELFHDLTRAVLETNVPTVAALNGLAVGGSSEFTLAFDARVGASRAGYFMPENGIGLTISNASSLLLFRLLRSRDAMRLVLDARRLDAAEALEIGLLDEVVKGTDPVPAAIALIMRWTPLGAVTGAHLKLLRPDPEAIDAAMRRETAAAAEVWRSGVSERGIERFWSERREGARDAAAPCVDTGATGDEQLRHCGSGHARACDVASDGMSHVATLRTFMSQEDVHYDGGLVAGARILGLFGDAGTALLLERDGVEGLLAGYSSIRFLKPVLAGDLVEVTATLESVGRTSRQLRFEARVGEEVVCEACGTAVAKPLAPTATPSHREHT
jgi:enoyl-CoA hydratase/carnithine racemase/acyl-CoA hydrolase